MEEKLTRVVAIFPGVVWKGQGEQKIQYEFSELPEKKDIKKKASLRGAIHGNRKASARRDQGRAAPSFLNGFCKDRGGEK